MKKRLCIIGGGGIPARYGGFETFAENIALELKQILEISVICSSKLYPEDEPTKEYFGINRVFYKIAHTGISSLWYDLKGLLWARKNSDYILLLGIGAGLLMPFIKSLKTQNLLLHIDGLEWIRSKWNFLIKLYLKLSYLIAVRYAHVILLDNRALQKYVPRRYGKKIRYLNYGGNHIPVNVPEMLFPESPYALVIARAEPENNLELILKVFKQQKNLNLIIISNWQNTSYGRKIYQSYSGEVNIHLLPAIYNNIRIQQYRMNCTIYIHGHSAGGTNPSLVEAMYGGLPIFAYDNEFNRITTNNLARYFRSKEDLELILSNTSQEELKLAAKEMQNFAFQNYTWKLSGNKLLEIIAENTNP